MAESKRDECPFCESDRPLNADGTLRAHRRGDQRCSGSGLTPSDARRAAEVTLPPEPTITPEVVTDPQPRPEAGPGTDLEPARRAVDHDDHTRTAIEAAADAALTMPGVPGRDEFLTLAVTARILSMSAAAPKAVKDNPHLAFHMALVGRDLGISPSAALELIDVLDTRGGLRLSLSPQLMNGQLRRLGLGSIRPIKRTMYECIAGAYGPDGELLGESEFTWEDAVIALLADDRCEPNKHWRPNSGDGKCRCNQGYRTYPKRMLWWRAAGFGADDYFPEAGLGMYTPEALGAAVDEDGRPLDPATVELPDGYQASHGNGPARGVPGDQRADGAELWAPQTPPESPQSVSDAGPPPQDPAPPSGEPAATQQPVDAELRATVEAEVVGLSVEDVETELRDTHKIDPAGMNPAMMRARLVMAEIDALAARGSDGEVRRGASGG